MAKLRPEIDQLFMIQLGDMIDPGSFWISLRNEDKLKSRKIK